MSERRSPKEWSLLLNEIVMGRSVSIPCAQYEALMAAAKELIHQHRDYYGKSDGNCKACKAIDALRAAGIQIGENEI